MKKINSEKAISDDLFKLKVGTTDKKIMGVVYIEGSCYLMPNFSRENYSSSVKDLVNSINKEICGIFKNVALTSDAKYVSNFEIAEDHISQRKRSCFSFQIFFQPKKLNIGRNISGFKEYYDEISRIVSNLLPKFKEMINKQGFSIYKTKK